MNKANECTCPSGDGSLRWPCPKHPAVEQAGGDERAAFKTAYLAEFDCDADGDDNMAHSNTAWRAWKMARAALAQPSPALELERPEVVARVVHSNPVVLGQCGPLNANDELMTVAQHAASVARWAEMFNRVEQERDSALAEVERLTRDRDDCLKARLHYATQLGEALARVAELEKQEPVAWVEVIDRDYGPYNFHGKRLLPKGKHQLYASPVAQAQQLHDLDKQCRDDVARALGLRPSQERGFAWSYLLASIKSCAKASEDAAQAQHSVPEGYALIPVRETDAMHDAVMALLYKGVARTDTQKLLDAYIAAAPGKEGNDD
ncbi:hypothetical protein ACSET1_12450 [Pseudomonas aeruginosa]